MRTTSSAAGRTVAVSLGAACIAIATVGGVTVAGARPSVSAAKKLCVNKKTGALREAQSCHHSEKAIALPRGPRGSRGAKGAPGPAGPITAMAPSGVTQHGVFNLADTGDAGDTFGGSVSFPLALSAPRTVEVMTGTTPPDAHCAGTADAATAAAGYLCFYINSASGNLAATAGDPLTVQNLLFYNNEALNLGALIDGRLASAGTGSLTGTWAVTAP